MTVRGIGCDASGVGTPGIPFARFPSRRQTCSKRLLVRFINPCNLFGIQTAGRFAVIGLSIKPAEAGFESGGGQLPEILFRYKVQLSMYGFKIHPSGMDDFLDGLAETI